MLPAALSSIAFHNNTRSIKRYFAENFPLHIAVHEVSAVKSAPSEYTLPHSHEDFEEINIIISPERLLYKIQLGNDEYTVSNNANIWIPKGMLHSANVLEGSGYFIALRIN
jgi:quercetin dioxygenase-like cupin family protein